jgi:hypothetical protein
MQRIAPGVSAILCVGAAHASAQSSNHLAVVSIRRDGSARGAGSYFARTSGGDEHHSASLPSPTELKKQRSRNR